MYVSSFDDNVHALSAASGTKQWAYYIGDEMAQAPTVFNNNSALFVATISGKILAFKLS